MQQVFECKIDASSDLGITSCLMHRSDSVNLQFGCDTSKMVGGDQGVEVSLHVLGVVIVHEIQIKLLKELILRVWQIFTSQQFQ